MFCRKCGFQLSDDAKFCPQCGTAAGVAEPLLQTPKPAQKQIYAGFWIRFLAYIIDQIVISVVSFVFFLIALVFTAGGLMSFSDLVDMEDPDPAVVLSLVGGWIVFGIIISIMQWLYYAFMESSASRGTLGKMALGLQIINQHGETITFARATGRYLAKILSGMILMIGYIIAAFTGKKQALHDILCDTYVVKQRDTFDYE